MGRQSLTIFDLCQLVAGHGFCGVSWLETHIDGIQCAIAELRINGPRRPALLLLNEPGALDGHGDVVAQKVSAIHIAIVECIVFRSIWRRTPVAIADLEQSVVPGSIRIGMAHNVRVESALEFGNTKPLG